MLEKGAPAPDFNLLDQDGKTHNLAEYKGKWVVLYFYPKDDTPGCTTEACNFRDNLPKFHGLDAEIIGISKDSVQSHQKFAKKYDLPFIILSDKDGKVCELYGVWREKSMYGKTYMGIVRSSFLIEPQGIIAKVYPKVNVKEHADELLRDLNDLK